MKPSKLSRTFKNGPPGAAPRLMFGSFPPEHVKFADMYLTYKSSLLPCKDNSREACNERQKFARNLLHIMFLGILEN